MEKNSLDNKIPHKDKINISINNNEHQEKLNSHGNYYSKNNHKILSNRPNSLLNNQRHTTIYASNNSNAIHIFKKSLKIPCNKIIESHINKLTFSNPNLT